VNVQPNGMVDVQYTNGMSRSLGMVVLAQFRSPTGLSRAGEGLFAQTRESGQAVLGGPGSGGRGSVSAGTVEGSNVDLAEEMVGMIRHQRAFGANSKVISTADEMLASFMNIKS
jgi:flagellar hook protein FlgE